jgi:hypothetical protein
VFHISVRKALGTWRRQALDAGVSEMHQLLVVKKAFHPVHVHHLSPAERRSIIRSSMFYKEKFKPDGEFEKLKARLVAGGDMQDKSVFGDISSPTVSSCATFLVAGIAAVQGRIFVVFAITGAYLNAKMVGPKVIMRLDPFLTAIMIALFPEWRVFVRTDGSSVTEVTQAIYGCIQSAKLWYEELCRLLTALGFVRNPDD